MYILWTLYHAYFMDIVPCIFYGHCTVHNLWTLYRACFMDIVLCILYGHCTVHTLWTLYRAYFMDSVPCRLYLFPHGILEAFLMESQQRGSRADQPSVVLHTVDALLWLQTPQQSPLALHGGYRHNNSLPAWRLQTQQQSPCMTVTDTTTVSLYDGYRHNNSLLIWRLQTQQQSPCLTVTDTTTISLYDGYRHNNSLPAWRYRHNNSLPWPCMTVTDTTTVSLHDGYTHNSLPWPCMTVTDTTTVSLHDGYTHNNSLPLALYVTDSITGARIYMPPLGLRFSTEGQDAQSASIRRRKVKRSSPYPWPPFFSLLRSSLRSNCDNRPTKIISALPSIVCSSSARQLQLLSRHFVGHCVRETVCFKLGIVGNWWNLPTLVTQLKESLFVLFHHYRHSTSENRPNALNARQEIQISRFNFSLTVSLLNHPSL